MQDASKKRRRERRVDDEGDFELIDFDAQPLTASQKQMGQEDTFEFVSAKHDNKTTAVNMNLQ